MAKINTQLAFEYIAAMGDDAFVMRQLDWIESGNLPVLTQELKSSKSSLFEFERCANMINNLITIVLFAKVTAIFT